MPNSARPRWPAAAELPDGHVATGLLLQMAHRAAHDRLAAELKPLGMDIRHFGILQFLARGGLTQRQLIDLVGVDKSTLVRIIDQLEEQGLAVRTRDPHDRRAFQVTVTERGRERLAAANAVAADLGDHLFGWLGAGDRRRLHELLQRIIQQAHERG
ncbi:MarR family transcriptional regulator [Dactylosporangium roseum]|uniref:MarR family transcriptional regulator n=1 Tax=Dactylosporangium roseum TaxID=47989 RepID=A0ABY5ZF41_9ACTN|nr:MarR family transcriptional regulator [Dactylosporangium roseum]UWZ38924.1 MarR family transcriptional regulator [Dactylosporangium roseum]